MSLHADAAERLLILDATTIHLAVNRTCNPTVSAALVAWTHDSGVDMKTTLSASSITTNRTDKPLIMQAQKEWFYDKNVWKYLDETDLTVIRIKVSFMDGKSISMATEWSAITYAQNVYIKKYWVLRRNK